MRFANWNSALLAGLSALAAGLAWAEGPSPTTQVTEKDQAAYLKTLKEEMPKKAKATAEPAATKKAPSSQLERTQDGFGVGQGGDGDEEAYLRRLREEMGGKIHVRRNTKYDTILSWNSRVRHLLAREKDRALRQINDGFDEAAKLTLERALITAGTSLSVDPEGASPLTKRLIDRGVKLDLMLNDLIEDEVPSKLDFLTQWIDFVLRTERDYDTPYFVPYHWRFSDVPEADRPREWSYRAMQMRQIAFAAEQLRFISKTFTQEHEWHGRRFASAIGSDEVFLRLAQFTARFTIEDLSDRNLYENWNGGVIRDLRELDFDLHDFLSGTDSPYRRISDAVDHTKRRLDDAWKELDEHCQELERQCRTNP